MAPASDRIKKWRNKRRIGQREFATLAGISHGLVYQIETGRVGVTAKTARKLARVLDCSWTTLVTL